MTGMEETPSAVSTAAVALIPKEANQTPTPLNFDESQSRAFCITCEQDTLR